MVGDGMYGLYDPADVGNAAWLEVPQPEFPGLDLTPGAEFWALLPLFVEGLRSVLQDGLRPEKAVVVSAAIAVGVGLQGSDVIGAIIGAAWGTLLSNGMMVGTLIAILLTAYVESSGRKRRRLETALNAAALPQVDEFLAEVAASSGWEAAAANRLRLVGEESLLSLMESDEDQSRSRLVVIARPSASSIELQLRTSADAHNLEDRLTFVSERAPASEGHTISLRLLSHFASTVRHRKYTGIDIVTVVVERTQSHLG